MSECECCATKETETNEAAIAERDRIVKMLEDRYTVYLANTGKHAPDATYGRLREMQDIISLLKGGNK